MTPEEEIRLLKWELKMRNDGYVGPFPEELMLNKIRKEDKMPIQKVKGGFRWGNKGKVYKNKAGAVKQARAIIMSQKKARKKIK